MSAIQWTKEDVERLKENPDYPWHFVKYRDVPKPFTDDEVDNYYTNKGHGTGDKAKADQLEAEWSTRPLVYFNNKVSERGSYRLVEPPHFKIHATPPVKPGYVPVSNVCWSESRSSQNSAYNGTEVSISPEDEVVFIYNDPRFCADQTLGSWADKDEAASQMVYASGCPGDDVQSGIRIRRADVPNGYVSLGDPLDHPTYNPSWICGAKSDRAGKIGVTGRMDIACGHCSGPKRSHATWWI
ncbi:hypothetical protein GHT06_003787 [Daphnia sinensis]|uniref:Uncharacterized protein n=1 Tax=Daphnia sinensis TaxID=1820382 RepID=A0AAD5PJZ4_9CRUS|nr:hypothetical protein GHT06_003787 [Daphnia sinensis]